MGLFRCIQVTLLTLRHNLIQELLADIHMVSQSTISRVAAVYTPLIAELLQARVPGVEDPRPGPSVHHRRHSGVLLVVARPSRAVLGQAQDHRSELAGGLHPGRTPSMDLLTPAG